MRVYLLFLFTFLSTNLFCQNEANNWYFGVRAGLNFATQTPQVLSDGQIFAPAGCASISDRNGNLQFYTNGNVVWNNNHAIMINGALIGGDRDAAQNSLIVPFFDNPDKYYIFSIGSTGLRYSVIDMSYNGGLGEVIEKNSALLGGAGVGKVSAVHHDDGKSIWVMTTRKNDNDVYTSFYAYKVNTDGSIDNPIISSNGLFYRAVVAGTMKFSPNGKKIACANYQPKALDDHLLVFDFNSQTGIVSNKMKLFTSFLFFEVVSAYGVAFSQDSKYLYATLLKQGILDPTNIEDFEPEDIRRNLLVQYDVGNSNPWTNSIAIHSELSELIAGSLQLAKNGKIYRALAENGTSGTEFLGVVNDPNATGIEARYTHNKINLNGEKSRLGLPNFVQSYFRTRILTEEGCTNNAIPFEVDTYSEITAAEWDFGDGSTSNLITPDHLYASPGTYNVSVAITTVNNRQIAVSKEVQVHSIPSLMDNQELIQCDTDTDGISNFNLYAIREKITNPDLNENLFFYESNIDAQQDIDRISNPEFYTNNSPNQEIFVRVVNENDCFEITSFFISATFAELGNISDMFACDGSDWISEDLKGLFNLTIKGEEIRNTFNLPRTTILKFYPTLIDAQTEENEIFKTITVNSSKIWVKAESDLACVGISPINLIVNDEPIIAFEDTYSICHEIPVTLLGNSLNERFEWLNSNNEIISTDRQYTFYNPGTFTFTAYKTQNGIECSNSKEIIIEKPEPPSITSIEVESESNTNAVLVNVEGDGIYEFSLDNVNFFGNSNTYKFTKVPAGIYTVYVRSQDDCVPSTQKQVYVMGFPKFFTPNNDGVNDYWKIKGLDRSLYNSITISIFDRFGKLITTFTDKNNNSWDGTFNGEILPPNDYWFDMKLIDTNNNIVQKKGHFSLVR